jgi:alpha-glutamyl/putrescinyl thymine pyrophosphorylase clade 1
MTVTTIPPEAKPRRDFSTPTRLLEFIEEREAIRRRREAGEPPPWTADPVLATYSFCNVRREDDRVTRWIAANWRAPNADNPECWFGMAVARLVNWPDTLEALGWPVPWDRERFVAVLGGRAGKVWGDAYNISNGGRSAPKAEVVADRLSSMWNRRASLRPRAGDSLLEFHGRLRTCEGMGDFMSAQVVADTKYVGVLRSARDWMTFAASGPGSRRGLNRLLGRPKGASCDEDWWRAWLRMLRETITPDLERMGLGDLHAQDLQNCLCEFDKSERVRLGEGKPKRKFAPRSCLEAAE